MAGEVKYRETDCPFLHSIFVLGTCISFFLRSEWVRWAFKSRTTNSNPGSSCDKCPRPIYKAIPKLNQFYIVMGKCLTIVKLIGIGSLGLSSAAFLVSNYKLVPDVLKVSSSSVETLKNKASKLLRFYVCSFGLLALCQPFYSTKLFLTLLVMVNTHTWFTLHWLSQLH